MCLLLQLMLTYQNKIVLIKSNNKERNKMSLQNFKILEKLGEGSFAKVYKAQRLTDNKIYAIKQIDISRLDEKSKQNTLNQIRFLASFQCRNIVKYYEAFFDEHLQLLCIVMEFAQGGDLGRIIAQKKAKAEKFYQVQIWRAFIGVMHGLAYIHERNILHRDVKPENIFVYNGDYKIGDLNVSKLAEQNLQQKQTQIGTPYYASPQIWQNCPYDNKCDVWALGCVAYQMAALNPPFSGKSMDKLYYEVTKGRIKPIPKHYSNELANIINKCLQKQASKRPSIKQLQQNFTIKMYENLYYTSDELQLQKSKCLPLLKTITLEKGKSMKNVQLPQANYEKEEVSERKQKSFITISQITKNNNTVLRQNSYNDQQQKREKNIFDNGSFNVDVLTCQKNVEFCDISMQESSIQSKRLVQRQVECIQAQAQLRPIQSVAKQLENVLVNKLDERKKQRSKQRIKTAQSPNKVNPQNENSSNNQKVRQHSQASVPKYMNMQSAHRDGCLKLKQEITLNKKPILLQRKSNEKLKIGLQNKKQTLEHNPQNAVHTSTQQQQPKKRRSLPRTELSAKKLQTIEHANSIKKSICQSQKYLQNNNNENIIDYKNLLLSKLPHHTPIIQNQKQNKKKTIIEQLVHNQQRVNNGLIRRGRPEEKLKQVQYQKQILEYNNGRNRKNIFINRELEAVVRGEQCGRGVRSVQSYAYL